MRRTQTWNYEGTAVAVEVEEVEENAAEAAWGHAPALAISRLSRLLDRDVDTHIRDRAWVAHTEERLQFPKENSIGILDN